MEGVELTKVKYTQVGIHQETVLNNDLGIKNEKQDYKIGMWGYLWEGGG
jgi:hypothetical protein